MAITLTYNGTVAQIGDRLQWIDEFNWSAVDQATAYSTTGALLVDVAVKLSGRSITLQGTETAAWVSRSLCETLLALANLPGIKLELVLRGKPRTVTSNSRRVITLHTATDDGAGGFVAGLGNVVYASKTVVIKLVSHDKTTESYNSDHEDAAEFERTGRQPSSGSNTNKGGEYGSASVGEQMLGTVMVRYKVAPLAPDTYTETFTPPDVVIDLCSYTTDRIVPGSVRLTWMGQTYEDFEGVLYRGRTSATPGVASGAVDYGRGLARMKDYVVAGSPTSIALASLWTQRSPWHTASLFFRTQSAPIKPGSLVLTLLDLAGEALTATAALDGRIEGPHLRGRMDFESGVGELQFGDFVLDTDLTAAQKAEWWYRASDVGAVEAGKIWRPWPVDPATLRYNSVAFFYLPLDADILGLDSIPGGRSPTHRMGVVRRIRRAARWGGHASGDDGPCHGHGRGMHDGELSSAVTWPRAAYRAAGFALIWDFGAAVEILSTRIGAGDDPLTWLESYTLEWSDEGGTWRRMSASDARGGSGLLWPGPRALTVHIGADPLWGRVLYQASFDGAMGAATAASIADERGRAVAVFGGCELRYGAGRESVLYTPGGGGNGVTLPIDSASDPLNLVNGDWTIEGWVSVLSYPTASNYSVFNWGGGYHYSWPNIRVHMDGDSGVSVALRSALAGDGPPDIANFVVTPNCWPGLQRWVHLALTREGPTFRLWINGALVREFASSLPLHDSANLAGVGIGSAGYDVRFAPAPSDGIEGLFDDFRITAACRYNAAFVPSAARAAAFGGAVLRTRQPASGAAAMAPVAAPGMGRSRISSARDVEFGGVGRIGGTTMVKGASNVPTKARVLLMHQRSKVLVRETWSDPVTGAWAIDGLDTRQDFLALAEDAAGNYRPVAASKLAPEVQA